MEAAKEGVATVDSAGDAELKWRQLDVGKVVEDIAREGKSWIRGWPGKYWNRSPISIGRDRGCDALEEGSCKSPCRCGKENRRNKLLGCGIDGRIDHRVLLELHFCLLFLKKR